MSQTLTFTPATPADAHELAGILTEAMRYKLAHQDQTWGDEPYSDAEAAELIAVAPTYLIHRDGETVGTVALDWEDEKTWKDPTHAGYLHRMALKDAFRGQGLGEQVLDWALKEVAKQGRTFLRLDCDSHNTGLCAYYESRGFTRVGTWQSPRNPAYLAALYERRVA